VLEWKMEGEVIEKQNICLWEEGISAKTKLVKMVKLPWSVIINV